MPGLDPHVSIRRPPIRRSGLILLMALLLAARAPAGAQAPRVPDPESHLGFRPGADNHLARWDSVVDYFQKVDRASDRVVVRELGRTTEDRPFLIAIVSSESTIRDLDRYRTMQALLADPRRAPPEGIDPVAQGKATVLITCTIHSSETASTLMAMELLHELSSGDDPKTKEILDSTILLLVPSVNPDGVETVARWYERTKGKPWEGSGMPWLYHKYAGHDTNRDWFMLNLKETQLLTKFLYKEWFPTITYDVHQMGSKGPRLFVPPFYDPINPNLDPWINQAIGLIGAHMAADLAAAGKRGVAQRVMYDNWWNGGNRTVPQRHNMVGILTEAASVRLASPIFLEKADLTGGGRGFRDHATSVDFPDPWPGGWWRLRDIVDYELIAARSILTLAARYREQFQAKYRALGLRSVERGGEEPPYGWVVPADQHDPGAAVEMLRILQDTGIEVHRVREPFRAMGLEFPAGSHWLPAAQPYRPHLKDMMERQVYPKRLTASGAAEPPYDVAGWTLPLQMGVKSVALMEKPEIASERLDAPPTPKGRLAGPSDPKYLMLRNRSVNDFRLLNAWLAARVDVALVRDAFRIGETEVPAGALLALADAKSRGAVEATLPGLATEVVGVSGNLAAASTIQKVAVTPRRLGLYQPWQPSMDEGWTRLVLEKFGFPYQILHNADIRAGSLADRIDVLLIPSIGPNTIRNGFGPDQTEPAYVGGLGEEGAAAIREFVKGGGVLIGLDKSCEYLIDELELPVKNTLKGLRSGEFYSPGSVLAANASPKGLLTTGMPAEISVYFDRSMAFEANRPDIGHAVSYAKGEVLQSGWLLGPEKIRGKTALMEVPVEKGRAVLFGFPPQHRGQPHGTFRLLFNAILLGGRDDRGPAVNAAE